MSKADQLRKMQEEMNSLRWQLKKANETIAKYHQRDKPMAMDFIKVKKVKK